MEKRRNRPIWGLFVVLLAIVLIGLLCEIVLKAVNATLTMRVRDPRIIVNQVFYGFGNEAVPLWAIPTLVLNWMSVMPRVVTLYGLRWLPYLCIFLLPVLCAVMRKRALPLILCAVVNGLVAIGIVLVRLFARQPLLHVATAIPFAVETLLLILACIALGTKSKGLSIVIGVLCVLFALLSPVISAGLSGLRAGAVPPGFPVIRIFLMQARWLPLSAQASPWPIVKTFALLMYALILFIVPSRFPKRA